MSEGDEVTNVEQRTELDISTAVRGVIKRARKVDGVVKGARECVKTIDRGEARLCILASDCEEEQLKKLVRALCKSNNVNLVEVDSRQDLGEWTGLERKVAPNGDLKKQVACSVAVIKNFGQESSELDFLMESFKA